MRTFAIAATSLALASAAPALHAQAVQLNGYAAYGFADEYKFGVGLRAVGASAPFALLGGRTVHAGARAMYFMGDDDVATGEPRSYYVALELGTEVHRRMGHALRAELLVGSARYFATDVTDELLISPGVSIRFGAGRVSLGAELRYLYAKDHDAVTIGGSIGLP